MEVETVQEEKLPLVQIDVADQELGLGYGMVGASDTSL